MGFDAVLERRLSESIRQRELQAAGYVQVNPQGTLRRALPTMRGKALRKALKRARQRQQFGGRA